MPQGSGHHSCGVHVSSDGIDSKPYQQDIHAQADTAMNVNDDDTVDYFRYVVSEENLEHRPRDWMQAKVMYEKILELSEP